MIEELKTFIAVVELKNFTKAAKEISISQPSVSVHIKNLENYFNTTLIMRSKEQKNIIITKDGVILYERAKKIINIIEKTKEEFIDSQVRVTGLLKIGASLTIGEFFLPRFLGEFNKRYPELALEISIENTSSICEKVSKLQLDVGLVEGLITYNTNIKSGIFAKDRLVVAVPKNYFEENGSLENATWISREPGSGTKQYLNMFLEKNHIEPKHTIVLGSNYAVKEAVKNRLGVTLISYLVVEKDAAEGELEIFELDQEYNRDFTYIMPEGIIYSKALKMFIKELKEYKNDYI
ncbi:LysR substrate-binding domain-containing protein [Clostridium sp. 'White wine YQ']|uniref:LysR substrate-binding domain-containing protein n=1 Tax=Clostridium sp. 'White wine YQ' TaxID=3027474 RepID=UPI0023654408|nr:LysR substrate-binding domain-containing protein [Clostridium sp. 'White wine YQ']MDD7795169.1 LysR substrate-binding domain-containing protein [Clostridium sp. 'White wine YQ']